MIIVACPCSQPGKVTQPHASPAKLPNPEHAGALGGNTGDVAASGAVVALACGAGGCVVLALLPPVALAIPPMMISAARPPSTVRTLCRRGHNVRKGRP